MRAKTTPDRNQPRGRVQGKGSPHDDDRQRHHQRRCTCVGRGVARLCQRLEQGEGHERQGKAEESGSDEWCTGWTDEMTASGAATTAGSTWLTAT